MNVANLTDPFISCTNLNRSEFDLLRASLGAHGRVLAHLGRDI
jgi:hypothetical protein